ncbi:ATP cone domain-containing protein [Psychroflexus halocasei]|uniref:Transcriptional regulator NrdR, contains Zn-ribbon and ATP-cone domains n=1 Tax=Psychroflexus halocasei TaxID=908615 RepID=A0A1H3VDJ9_9FLAO|nr:ATP cone domain-containing protein [Psychroflexus halocasei]SDZ72876.1 Transcriptional regulator NrdR, contains Zn-ribbon and ATP-cone domains [Psychroflexus halocasei]
MKASEILVKKSSDELESFDLEKLKSSLRRSMATKNEIDKIINEIIPLLYDGISTKEIYKKAFTSLKKLNRVSASRYSLKKAIFDLGPTGFPFERLIAALLQNNGFDTEIGKIIQGKCISHEVDVLAYKNNNIYAVECKFHSIKKSISNVKVPLYINSRFIDIKERWENDDNENTSLKQGWLVTNTRFSSDAVRYSKCVGLHLLSWNYPENNGIKHNIDKYALYPITTLTSLTKHEKNLIIENDIILTKELYATPEILNKIGVSKVRKKRIISEVKYLCNL